MDDNMTARWDDPKARSTQTPSPRQAAPVKQIVTIRLDVDVLEWFKSQGPGYQTRINQLLREQMATQRAQQAG